MGVITFCGFDICRPFSSPPELIGSGKKSNVMWITLLNTTKKVCHGIMLSTNTLLLVLVSVKLLVCYITAEIQSPSIFMVIMKHCAKKISVVEWIDSTTILLKN